YAPKLSAQRDAVLLNPKLFARVEALYAARDKAAPNAEAKRLIERYHRDMVRAGARLNDEQKARMKAINAELATLGAQFNKAVLAEVNDS
ncbi:dipeptidyl carboxypeptidase II, partial [Klebsiella pneumoniae]|nr:dipeptidyl carboxypeptidase II [Klebsiella pneumoniae]